MFRTVFPSDIRSSRLYIQQQAFVKQLLLSACWHEYGHNRNTSRIGCGTNRGLISGGILGRPRFELGSYGILPTYW